MNTTLRFVARSTAAALVAFAALAGSQVQAHERDGFRHDRSFAHAAVVTRGAFAVRPWRARPAFVRPVFVGPERFVARAPIFVRRPIVRVVGPFVPAPYPCAPVVYDRFDVRPFVRIGIVTPHVDVSLGF